MLAYAITIHKSQGLSLNCAMVAAGSTVFEHDQIYVALSRVTTLEGLHLLTLAPTSATADRRALEEYNRLRSKYCPQLPLFDCDSADQNFRRPRKSCVSAPLPILPDFDLEERQTGTQINKAKRPRTRENSTLASDITKPLSLITEPNTNSAVTACLHLLSCIPDVVRLVAPTEAYDENKPISSDLAQYLLREKCETQPFLAKLTLKFEEYFPGKQLRSSDQQYFIIPLLHTILACLTAEGVDTKPLFNYLLASQQRCPDCIYQTSWKAALHSESEIMLPFKLPKEACSFQDLVNSFGAWVAPSPGDKSNTCKMCGKSMESRKKLFEAKGYLLLHLPRLETFTARDGEVKMVKNNVGIKQFKAADVRIDEFRFAVLAAVCYREYNTTKKGHYVSYLRQGCGTKTKWWECDRESVKLNSQFIRNMKDIELILLEANHSHKPAKRTRISASGLHLVPSKHDIFLRSFNAPQSDITALDSGKDCQLVECDAGVDTELLNLSQNLEECNVNDRHADGADEEPMEVILSGDSFGNTRMASAIDQPLPYRNSTGVECYVNSTLQFLGATKIIPEIICQTLTNNNEEPRTPVALLHRLFSLGGYRETDSSMLRFEVARSARARNILANYEQQMQQDASEFLSDLVALLDELLGGKIKPLFTYSLIVKEHCKLNIHHQEDCRMCDELFYCVLYFPPRNTNSEVSWCDIVSYTFREETLDDNRKCPHPECKSQRVRQEELVLWPQQRYLLVNLSRFQLNSSPEPGLLPTFVKDHTTIVGLNANLVTLAGHRFRVIAAMAHIGQNKESGHWITYRRQDDSSSSWWECNDERISSFAGFGETTTPKQRKAMQQVTVLLLERTD